MSSYAAGMLYKAAEAAATYLALEPSDDVMAKNIHYYTSDHKVSPEKFVPRQVGNNLTCKSIFS